MNNMTERDFQAIFDCADRQREIEKFLQEFLYDNAKEMECYCTWLIEYPQYNEKVGFEFKIELTSEDKKYKAKKIFYVGYEWESEKRILEEIVLYLLNELKNKNF